MSLSRRQFVRSAGAAAALAFTGAPARARTVSRRAPFRLLYNNDTTNVAGCTSPWHPRGAPFQPQMLAASVNEAAAADAQLLAPGLCEIPWWPSKVLPLAEHAAWFRQTYGIGPDGFSRFILEGGDLIQIFIDRCRALAIAPFISFRLNDAHHKEHVNAQPGEKLPGGAFSGISQFYHDHPEWRIGPNVQSGSQHVLNWAVPEVRARKLAFLTELCGQYEIDGLELDFLRYYSFFQLDKTDPAQRLGIQLEFLQEVRALLDRTTRGGGHRWLSVRIPCHLAAHDAMGIDVAAFERAGVEMFNLSGYYATEQQTDAPALRERAPDSAFYLELTQTTQQGANLSQERKYDDFTFRRTTETQMKTTAHLAHRRGLQGMSLFNFAYFREHGTPGRGPFSEPPFELLPRLKDAAWLAQQKPQQYFLARITDEPRTPGRQLGSTQKPRLLTREAPMTLTLDLAPPSGGWQQPGRLRLQAAQAIAPRELEARMNGTLLSPAPDTAEHLPDAHPALAGTPETLRAWTVPLPLARDGANEIELRLLSGEPIDFLFADLTIE